VERRHLTFIAVALAIIVAGQALQAWLLPPPVKPPAPESREAAEPDDRSAQAREAALRAGHARGKAIGGAGLPCPARVEQQEMAASDGVPPDLSPHYRSGLLAGWAAAQDEPAA